MPGAICKHRIDVLCGQQGIEPGIELFGRSAVDPFSVHRSKFTELQSHQTQKRIGLPLGLPRGDSRSLTFGDPGSLALFHPDLCGGSHDFLHRFRVRPRPPQRSHDALGRQADLFDDIGQYVAPKLRLRNSGNQEVVLGGADILVESAGQRLQCRAHFGAPRKLPWRNPSEIVKHVTAEGAREVFQTLGRMDHLLDRAGHCPRLPSVKEHDRDDRWQAAVRQGSVVHLLAPDLQHVPDELERRAVINLTFVLKQRVDNHLTPVPEVEAEESVGLRLAALAIDDRTLDMDRRALRI